MIQFLTDEPDQPDRGLLDVGANIATQLARVFERVRGQEALARQALHDPLTGLPNRALFHDRLDQAVAEAARRGETLAVTMAASDEWTLAQSIVRLIRALKLETVAEGVETGAQLAHLPALGCDHLQGYYFARPEPAETFRVLLGAPSHAAAPGG